MPSFLAVRVTALIVLGALAAKGRAQETGEAPAPPHQQPDADGRAAQQEGQSALRAQIEALQKEVDALRKEISDLRSQSGLVIDIDRVRERLHSRIPKYRVHQQDPARVPATQPGIPGDGASPADNEAATDSAPAPASAAGAGVEAGGKLGGRLLGDAEKAGLPPGTVFTVDGSPVSRNELEDTVAYLRSYLTDLTEAQIRELAMKEIIRVHAVEAAYRDRTPALKERIEAARQKVVVAKEDFDEVAKEMSDCPTTRDKGGDLDFFGRESKREPNKPSPMVLPLAKAAFEAPIGEVVGPITTEYGYHLIRVTGRSPGATRLKDKVRASHILVMFDKGNQDAVAEAVARAENGKVDLGFVDASVRGYAPEAFRR
jgi:TolA-binding protein